MMPHIWKDTFENGKIFAELTGTRLRARVLVLPITYGRKPVKSGYAYHYGSRGGVVKSIPEAKWLVEQMVQHFEQKGS